MSDGSSTSEEIKAPAKINLFLHIVGKRADGYHELQSLAAFADFGDKIKITTANEFSFEIDNKLKDCALNNGENNLVIKATELLKTALNKNLDLSIRLSKNIPIGAGLGGGSADAAATVKALLSFWGQTLPPELFPELSPEISQEILNDILLQLGADVPICYAGTASYMEGIGEIITPLTASLPNVPALLIYPNQFCSTVDIFNSYNAPFSPPIKLPQSFADTNDLCAFLKEQRNDLTTAACQNTPIIKDVLETLKNKTGCRIARMSGSGSACFGIFQTVDESKQAAEQIQKERPDWWVRPIIIQ